MSEISKKFSPDLYEAIYLVDEEHDGWRLDQYCALYFSSFSRQQIKKKIQAGEVTIFDRPTPHKPSTKVYYKEKVRIFTPRGTLEDEYWNGEKLELELDPPILFEDENYIVISKPPYMTTHPTGKHLFNCATVYFENKLGQTIHSVHRLDRETSGVQILGKNPKSAESMGQLFEKDLIAKCYFLIAHKNAEVDFPFVAKERLGQDDNYIPRLFVHCYEENSPLGKHAKTRFVKIAENKNYYLALALPITGRQHQIRAHAACHGFPLVGDKLYNGDPTIFMRFKDEIATKEDHEKMQLSRHALHAIAVKYLDPNNDESKIHIAPLPKDLLDWLANIFPANELQDILGKIPDLIHIELNKAKE